MKSQTIFKEKQSFTIWWLYILLLGLNAILIYGFYQQVIMGKPYGSQPASDTFLIVFTLLMLLFTLFMLSLRLDTLINKEGIAVRFYPIHQKYKFYPWEEIESYELRTYQPIKEYGGWGIRRGVNKSRALNVKGNQGLQLVFKDGSKLLIGTQDAEQLAKLLGEMEND